MPHDADPLAALRPLRAADAPAVLAAFSSAPDMARQGDVTTLADAERQVRWMLAGNVRSAAVVDVHDALIGVVSIMVDTAHRSGWVSYWMHADRRGRGIMSRAVATVCARALAAEDAGGWGIERLELGHRVDNPASGRVAAAAGFVREGREREKLRYDGRRVDVLAYGRLRSDPVPATAPLPWRG